MKLRLLGLGKVSAVKPLSDDMAVELAADMLGEAVVFGVATACLLFEFKRQQRKEVGREDLQNTRLQTLESTLATLSLDMEEQNARLREIQRLLAAGGKLLQDSHKTTYSSSIASSANNSVPDFLIDNTSKATLHVSKH